MTVRDLKSQTTSFQWYSQQSTGEGSYNFSPDLNNTLWAAALSPQTQPMVLDIDGDQNMDVLWQKDNGPLMVSLGTDKNGFQAPKNFFGQYVVSSSEDAGCQEPNTQD